MKRNMQKGITLIALVVTVVILIILATISINIIFQNNGLLDKTNTAKELQALNEEKERLELIKPVVAIKNKGEVNVEKYVQELIEQGITTIEEVEENADGSKQLVTDRGYDVNIKQDGAHNVIITIEGKVEGLPIKIVGVKLTVNSNHIKVDVEVRRAEGASYKYYYKTADTEYVLVEEGKELSCIINNTDANTTYKIKVEATNQNGTVIKEVMTVKDAVGNIIFGNLKWTEGKAEVTVSKAESVDSSLNIKYKINTGNYQTIENGGKIDKLNLNDIVTVRLTDGINQGNSASLTVADTTIPKEAIITLSSNTTDTSSNITAKVEQIDEESGVDITKSKWIYHTSQGNIGTNENDYTNSFKNNPETITLKEETEGTYYLHVLTIDKAGNKKETISNAVVVEKPDISITPIPKISEGMIPVKWNGSNWVKTTVGDSNWYNYKNKQWANIVLSDATFNGDKLDESKPYSQLVWIPRFAYKITSGWHSKDTGDIEVVLINTNNQDRNGTIYNGTYSEAIDGITSGGAMKNYVVEPAFDYGDKKLEGFWIGKFESSHRGCTTVASTGRTEFTGNEVMQIKANVTSWRNITIGDAFDVCLAMNKTGNPYGLSTNDSIVDPHLIKNTEWGAVAYLSKSKYGKETEEVFINNSSDFITGNAGNMAYAGSAAGTTNAYHITNGQKASTTGNIYGVYDMNGGSFEYVSAYLNNNNASLQTYGKSVVSADVRYKDLYQKGNSDTEKANYDAAITKYGDAIYETSGSTGVTTSNSWNQDNTAFFYDVLPFFLRGGHNLEVERAGLFASYRYTGAAYFTGGFRLTIAVF